MSPVRQDELVGALLRSHKTPMNVEPGHFGSKDLERRWEYKTSPRVLGLFTGKVIRNVPKDLSGAGVRRAQAWARATETRFYVQQNPTMPGRIWHFRVSPELQEAITGYPIHPGRPQFELYEMLPDPIPANPDLWSLLYVPAPVLSADRLEAMTRRLPMPDSESDPGEATPDTPRAANGSS